MVALAVLLALIFSKKVENKQVTAYTNFHYASFKDKTFYGGIEDIKSREIIKEKVYGGILSHHLYVASEIAKFFAGLKNQHPKTVVIIGPNHYSLGVDDILVSKYPYRTPWGILEPDIGIIEQLLKDNIIKNNERPFEIEHSIAASVSYVKAVFPDAKLVPIIIKRNTSRAKLDQLVNDLSNLLSPDTLILASVDFSHHSNEIVSEFHDQKSISAIENFDYDTIFNLEIDSPPTIYSLLKYLENKNAQKMEYVNTNSAIFGANLSSEDVTSYLFSYFTNGEPKKNENISVLNFGDMMFDRGVRTYIQKGKDPFEFIRGTEGNFLRGVDFIIGNLEGSIIETSRNNCQNKEIVFQFASTTPRILWSANINLVNLANNHSFDCYQEGVDSTQKYLNNYGIGYFGNRSLESSYIIKKVHNKTVAFVGIDQVTQSVPIEKFYSLVKKLKKENDYVVVNIHWGYEYDKLQSKIQVDIAHILVDNGADVIFGHHPHVVQPLEIYKGKAIFYSLGNLIFDQQTPGTNQGIGVGIILDDNRMNFYIFPYSIVNTQPKLLPYKDAFSFCNNFLINIETKNGCSFGLTNI